MSLGETVARYHDAGSADAVVVGGDKTPRNWHDAQGLKVSSRHQFSAGGFCLPVDEERRGAYFSRMAIGEYIREKLVFLFSNSKGRVRKDVADLAKVRIIPDITAHAVHDKV